MKLQFNQTGNADKTLISHNILHNYPINPKDAKVIKICRMWWEGQRDNRHSDRRPSGWEEILYYEGEEELYLVFHFYSEEEHYYAWLYIIANFLMYKQVTYSIFLVKKKLIVNHITKQSPCPIFSWVHHKTGNI